MEKIIKVILLAGVLISTAFAYDPVPEREFRGVWLSTVANIDWPVNKEDSEAKKQNDLKAYLVKLKDSGCNAVLFQVRCACDAMYDSPYEPWSYWFSGEQGKGPSVDWDPLEFAVTEAHKLGMELHAWVNPYRAVVSPQEAKNNSKYISDEHVTRQHPDWILEFSDVHILDPGLPQARNYITDVLLDIVTRYDIDGLHMDDYFYPYSGISDEDADTYENYSRGIENIHDWRRGNINLLVQSVMDSINEVKPWVKWGISPFGIYKPNIPEGITGMNAYATLYCDPLAWLKDGSVDYLTPQCYWPFGGGQDYGKLIPWWAEQTQRYGKHLYPGQAMYRAGLAEFPRGEIPRQIRLNRKTDNCDGSVFFTANDFYDNHKNTIDSLRQNLYRYPSLWPVMSWKDSVPPEAPQNTEYIVETDGSKTLNWQAPAYTDPLDSALAYVVYRTPYPLEEESRMEYVKDIQFHRDKRFQDSDPGMYYYKITALDRNKLESAPADIDYPFVHPLYPQYASVSVGKDTCFRWRNYETATQYTLEISPSGDFNSPLYQLTLNDTVKDLELSYDTQYFWRIKADNTPYWSPEWYFKTELPPPIRIISPLAYYEGTDLDVSFRWHPYEDAVSYEIQIAHDPDMNDIVMQAGTITDTVWSVSGLEPATGYYWRIRSNKYDNWNEVLYFKTRNENIRTLWQYAAITGDSYIAPYGSGIAVRRDADSLLYVVSSSGGSASAEVFDARNGYMVDCTLDLSGVSGGSYPLRDIEVSEDGVIYACNGAAPGETFKIYQWTDPWGTPTVVYRAENIAYRLGDHITVCGRQDDGSIVIYAPASMADKLVKLEWDNTAGGFNGQQIRLQNDNLGNACMAEVPDSDDMFVNSSGTNLTRYSRIGMFAEWTRNNPAMPLDANAIASFEYGGRNFVAAYSSSSESVHVIDVSDNLSEASSAGSTYRLGINENPTADGDVKVLDNGDGTFTIYVLGRNNGLAAYEYDAVSVIASAEDIATAESFSLDANYPNPFNPVTVIPYRLDKRRDIEIAVYDLSGKRIRTLFNGMQEAGRHTLHFNAADLSSGMYLCVLRSGNAVRTRKITLIK